MLKWLVNLLTNNPCMCDSCIADREIKLGIRMDHPTREEWEEYLLNGLSNETESQKLDRLQRAVDLVKQRPNHVGYGYWGAEGSPSSADLP